MWSITDAVTSSLVVGDVATSAAAETDVDLMTMLVNSTTSSRRRFVNCSGELYSMARVGGDHRSSSSKITRARKILYYAAEPKDIVLLKLRPGPLSNKRLSSTMLR